MQINKVSGNIKQQTTGICLQQPSFTPKLKNTVGDTVSFGNASHTLTTETKSMLSLALELLKKEKNQVMKIDTQDGHILFRMQKPTEAMIMATQNGHPTTFCTFDKQDSLQVFSTPNSASRCIIVKDNDPFKSNAKAQGFLNILLSTKRTEAAPVTQKITPKS